MFDSTVPEEKNILLLTQEENIKFPQSAKLPVYKKDAPGKG